ncbi:MULTISPECIES: LytR/AlgR family response regulator transcription factor [Spirosoma]|uniref:LytTR family transcriptional regulator n=1 Tax=Spirosoma liriopis TaxID=2937440 RepID=A0ABT0HJ84_9BACT|nr:MULTISPECIES: LytTR family DNA-binding domain-containing protein [Spirosoma]MCK8492207.1 LytTR family transcriptional regulator [Spirosoma liriopis]UHG91624.1 LytTR family transcriptional regulator [Spirosoma oryzicola]
MKAALLQEPLSSAYVEQIALQFDMPDLVLPFWGYRKKMPMHQIVRLEGEGNYTLFHFSDGSQLMVSLTLKKMESRLSSKVFVRPHKKNIINLLYLEGVYPETVQPKRPQLSVGLVNGHRIEVSRRKASQFIKQVKGFQEEIQSLNS